MQLQNGGLLLWSINYFMSWNIWHNAVSVNVDTEVFINLASYSDEGDILYILNHPFSDENIV